jgi:hypothetical protein
MNFKFSKIPSKPGKPPVGGLGSVFDAGDEVDKSDGKPFDYVKARIESQQRQAALEAMEAKAEDHEDSCAENPTDPLPSATVLGPAGLAAKQLGRSSEERSMKTESLTRPGLVLTTKDMSRRGESKHIQRMMETSEVNEKFKNLLRMKVSEKEKLRAEEEFGQRPEEFITSAYIKKREESLQLEKELEGKESKSRDIKNLFKEMLESGAYARSNYTSPPKPLVPTKPESLAPAAIPITVVKTVLEKVVPQSSREVASLIEEKAKMEAFKIVEQLEANGGDEVDREQARLSARERYMQRKKQKLGD